MEALKFCEELLKHWKILSKDPELEESMKKWKKYKAIHLVAVSDKFGRSPPSDVDELKTCRLLSSLFDDTPDPQILLDTPSGEICDAEKDQGSDQQLKQHMMAYSMLMNDSSGPLSEELIKKAHHTLMNNLHREDEMIHAGEYRLCQMYAGDHNFIEFQSVPKSMLDLVKQYNEKQSGEHHIFELAGWLLMKMLQIHPFEDGNGRLSRLLWCYSLQKDGLPFPITPFPGVKKAYKQCIKCIDRDQESLGPEYKYMTSLTLISTTRAWLNFITNLKLERKEKFDQIITWLKESGNLLETLD